MLVDPGLPARGGDLPGVEPGGARGDLPEEPQDPPRQGLVPGVAQEDEDALAPAEAGPDLGSEPVLLGGAPAGREDLTGGDVLSLERLGVADLEGLEVAGRPVEVGGQLDERPEQAPGAVRVEAVRPDAGEELLLEAPVLGEEVGGERVVRGEPRPGPAARSGAAGRRRGLPYARARRSAAGGAGERWA